MSSLLLYMWNCTTEAKVHDSLSTYVCHLMLWHAIYIRMWLTDLHTCLHIFLSNQRIGQFNPRLIEPTVSLWFGKATQFSRFELLTTLVKIWPMPMLIDAVTIATITPNSCSPASNPQTDTCSSTLGEGGLRRAMSCWFLGVGLGAKNKI